METGNRNTSQYGGRPGVQGISFRSRDSVPSCNEFGLRSLNSLGKIQRYGAIIYLYLFMSSWAGFTDEELFHLRQNTSEDVDAEGKILGSSKKAAINIPKRQRPREKIRTRAPSTELKESDKQEGNEDQGHSDRTPTRQRTSRSGAGNIGRSTSRFDSREDEQENSSPECERRGKSNNNSKEEITMSEEAPPKRRPIKEREGSDREHAVLLADNQKELGSDLPEIIDSSDK